MSIEEILTYWFGSNPDDAAVAKEKSALWWSKNREGDKDLRQRYANLVAKAAVGDLSEWQATPPGRLALILLMDQFPRCIYRDSPQAFADDAQALAYCLDSTKRTFDLKLRPIERVFFYLPLEHSESLAHQEQSVKLFRQWVESVGREHYKQFQDYLDFAVRHRDIIARFGHFPHRNNILGRESTAEEKTFLAEPGSSF